MPQKGMRWQREVAGILISSVKVPVALTLAEVIDVARTADWCWI